MTRHYLHDFWFYGKIWELFEIAQVQLNDSALKIFIIDILRRVLSSCYHEDTIMPYKDIESRSQVVLPIFKDSLSGNHVLLFMRNQ